MDRKQTLDFTFKIVMLYQNQINHAINGSRSAICSAMVKTAIDLSMPISTTQIVQTKRHQTVCDSAISQQLLNNDQCALNYDNKRFSILAAACSSFHHNLFETAYIKTRRPVLCRQKEFVYTLKHLMIAAFLFVLLLCFL